MFKKQACEFYTNCSLLVMKKIYRVDYNTPKFWAQRSGLFERFGALRGVSEIIPKKWQNNFPLYNFFCISFVGCLYAISANKQLGNIFLFKVV